VVHDPDGILAGLVCEPPDVPRDRHAGRVLLTREVLGRHERLSSEGMVVFLD
jgi:hypothetical protein